MGGLGWIWGFEAFVWVLEGVKNKPKKHGSDAYRWEIGEHIHLLVQKALKTIMTSKKFEITCDGCLQLITNTGHLYTFMC
jgi:hypothetical protein